MLDLLLEITPRRIEEVHELDEFGGAERMNVDIGKFRLDSLKQFDVPLEVEGGIHAALHQDLGAADLHQLPDLVEEGFVIKRVGVVLITCPLERAEDAFGSADIGVVDVAIDDVGSEMIPMKRPTSLVRQATQGLGIASVVEIKRLLWSESGGSFRDRLKKPLVKGVQVGMQWGGGTHGVSFDDMPKVLLRREYCRFLGLKNVPN